MTVPAGRVHYFSVTATGTFTYHIDDRLGPPHTSFYASWQVRPLADGSPAGLFVPIVSTGYRMNWDASGVFYWNVPVAATWTIRLEGGTHSIGIEWQGYSDGTMALGRVANQAFQVVQLE